MRYYNVPTVVYDYPMVVIGHPTLMLVISFVFQDKLFGDEGDIMGSPALMCSEGEVKNIKKESPVKNTQLANQTGNTMKIPSDKKSISQLQLSTAGASRTPHRLPPGIVVMRSANSSVASSEVSSKSKKHMYYVSNANNTRTIRPKNEILIVRPESIKPGQPNLIITGGHGPILKNQPTLVSTASSRTRPSLLPMGSTRSVVNTQSPVRSTQPQIYPKSGMLTEFPIMQKVGTISTQSPSVPKSSASLTQQVPVTAFSMHTQMTVTQIQQPPVSLIHQAPVNLIQKVPASLVPVSLIQQGPAQVIRMPANASPLLIQADNRNRPPLPNTSSQRAVTIISQLPVRPKIYSSAPPIHGGTPASMTSPQTTRPVSMAQQATARLASAKDGMSTPTKNTNGSREADFQYKPPAPPKYTYAKSKPVECSLLAQPRSSELLRLVFRYLGIRELSKVSQVCHLWNLVASQMVSLAVPTNKLE